MPIIKQIDMSEIPEGERSDYRLVQKDRVEEFLLKGWERTGSANFDSVLMKKVEPAA